MKKVKWRWDMGCYIAFCPYCNEPAYFNEHCEFCGKEYKWKEGRYKPREVVVGKYTITQTSSRGIYIYDNDRNKLVFHAPCTKRKSKRQLKKTLLCWERGKGISEARLKQCLPFETELDIWQKGADDERN